MKIKELFILSGAGLMAFAIVIAFMSLKVGYVTAGNYGSSVEGDSTVVAYTHHTEADSAHCAFIYGGKDAETNAYDSSFLYPVGGGTDGLHLIADNYLDLDSAGMHVVRIITFNGGAVIDTTYGGWFHDVVSPTLLDTLRTHTVILQTFEAYWGTCDGCYTILYPRDGSANKDSAIVIDPSQTGSDTLRGKTVWFHNNVPGVYDSSYYYFSWPW